MKCKRVSYCCREHQVLHWKHSHKRLCQPPALALSGAGAGSAGGAGAAGGGAQAQDGRKRKGGGKKKKGRR